MKLRLFGPIRSLARYAAGLALAAGASLTTVQAQQATDLFYFVNGQRIPLQADPGQVLVQGSVTTDGGRAVARAAGTLGAPQTAVSNSGLPGWNRVDLTATSGARSATNSVQGAAAARNAVASLSRQAGVAFASPVLTTAQGATMSPTAQIMVRYRTGQDPARAFTAFRNPALVSQTQIGTTGIWMLTTNLRDGFAVLALANTLQGNAAVEYATPDFIQRATTNLVPSDPQFPLAWGLRNNGQTVNGRAGTPGFDMQATTAWDVTMGSSSIIVLVMDTGAQLNHPDLVIAGGRDFTGMGGSGGPVNANDNHGTAVAGCVAARANGLGTTGVAPGVRIATAKIAGVDSSGYFINYRDSNVVGALDWGRSLGARVSNSSWGGGSASSAVEDAFRTTRNAGMVHFAAAGNGYGGPVNWPASSPHVYAVGATANNGTRASFSSYGTGLAFMAPGQDIMTTDRTGSSGYNSGDTVIINGTSFAAPYAAGVAALLLSREPSLTPSQVFERMKNSCVDMGPTGYDTGYGWGHLNAYRTLVPGSGDDHGSTLATATLVSFPGTWNGTINPATDEDMVRFVISSTVTATFSSAAAFDTYAYLYNSSGTQIAYDDDSNGNLQFRIQIVLQAGTYYLKARSYNQLYTGSYSVTMTGVAQSMPRMTLAGLNGTTITDGDTSPSSTDGTLFSTVTTRNTTAGRTFTVRSTGNATLTLSGSPLVQITGANADQFRVTALPSGSIGAGGSTTFALEYAPTTPGTHAATVSLVSNDTTASPYTFAVSGAATFPVDDHGNSLGTATYVSRPAQTAGTLHNGSDVDYFVFTVASNNTRVTIRSTGGTDVYGYLLNSAGSILAANDDNSSTDLNFTITAKLAAGTYYVRVQGYDSSVTGQYVLRTE